jgi:8-oxo-dGTP pyrophosphatase MutT (NUDIX family)
VTSEEWVDHVDTEDRVLGTVTRRQMRRDNLWHRTVMILCLDPLGRVYVHRRTPHKDVFPGLYDMFVGGVVGAGEAYDVAALREIGEELGIVGPTPQFLFKHRYEDQRSRSHIAVYSVTWGGPITHQPSEVDWGAYFELPEVARNTAKFAYVPDGWEVFQRFIELQGAATTSR